MTDLPADGKGMPNSVRLRPIEVGDAPRVHEWASQERACRFQAWGPNTRQQTDQFVAEAARTWQQPEGSRLVWAATSPMGEVIGMAETRRHTSTCNEISYAVHIDLWGRGLGTEIARLLIADAFSDPGIERVQATCDPRNEASAGVLRRSGLVLEGTLRHTLLLRDGWRDSLMYSILRNEWAAQSATL